MRTIKFRAWDKKYKCWVTEKFGLFLEGTLIRYDRKAGEIDQIVFRSENQYSKLIGTGFEDIELIQFTGLHDKNGKEIWEEDVIIFAKIKHIVRFLDGGFRAVYIHEPDIVQYSVYGLNCEVLGNIYENPELLKQK